MNAVAVSTAEVLAVHEAVVAANIDGFRAAGEALRAIRDGKLYKASHKSWDVYCRDRWAMSPDSAYRRIGQADAAAALPASVPAPSQRSIKNAARARQNASPSNEPAVISAESRDIPDVSSPAPVTAPAEAAQPSLKVRVDRIESVVAQSIPETLREARESLGTRDMLRLARELRSWADRFEIAAKGLPLSVHASGSNDVTTRFKSRK